MKKTLRTSIALALLGVAGLAGAPRLEAAARAVPVIEAVKRGDATAIRTLIRQKADVNATEPDGTTALHWAADMGHVELVDLLLKAGAKLKVANRFGSTPFGLAAGKGFAPVLERMLQAGEDASAVVNGEPVLMLAARAGDVDAVKLLLAKGADPNTKEPARDQTALMWAAAEGNTGVVKTLLEAGADIKARSKAPGKGLVLGTGFVVPRMNDPLGLRSNRDSTSWGIQLDGLQLTPLMWAARAGHIDTMRALVAGGANVNEAKPEGTTPLILAVINHHWEAASVLLDLGADPNKGPGYTALHQLAWSRRLNLAAAFHPGFPEPTGHIDSMELAKRLVAKGVKVNAQMTESFKDNFRNRFNRIGATAFLLSAKLVDVPLMKFLVANGADRTIRNKDGDSPLMVAAGVAISNPGEDPGSEAEVMAAVKYLVDELGEDVNYRNNNNETALHGASYRTFISVAQYLVNKGAKLHVENVIGWTPLSISDGAFYAGLHKAFPPMAAWFREQYVKQGLAVPPPPGELLDTKNLTQKNEAYDADLKRLAAEATAKADAEKKAREAADKK